ncbi:helix-turn-helix domain-containing protein [Anaeroarcus burkinensis]|uniref:helix-turn-helix domain-containing protein n=1 Tax=Anaeroarcus burkinensis TaxID=82376 RepID=UPI0003FC0837|nr:helix-turn-helix domain-containing protein [Anaeroarcus burkinensis]
MKKLDNVTSWEELPLMLNTKQVAELTGYGPQTIRELCHAQKIPFVKFGKGFMFYKEALKQWIEQATRESLQWQGGQW